MTLLYGFLVHVRRSLLGQHDGKGLPQKISPTWGFLFCMYLISAEIRGVSLQISNFMLPLISCFIVTGLLFLFAGKHRV
ncbi:MAG TPA: hypothetical protein VIY47_00310, partial [Ignavibacteriaceae bacterium]